MEALRKQLSETEGHLQDRDRKYRELNAKFKASALTWTDCVEKLEHRVKDLERQNEELRKEGRHGSQHEHKGSSATTAFIAMATDTPPQQPHTPTAEPSAAGDSGTSNGNVIVITPEHKRYMEQKYQKVKDRLTESENKVAWLQERLSAEKLDRLQPQKQQKPSEGVTPEQSKDEHAKEKLKDMAALAIDDMASVSVPRDPNEPVTAGHATARFTSLREAVRQISTTYFNEPRDLAKGPVPPQHAKILEKLSPNWRSFLADQGYSSYLFRALIWRYLDEFMFKKPESIWDANVGPAMAHIANKICDKDEALKWRLGTAETLHATAYFDMPTLENLAQIIISSTEWYLAKDEDKPKLALSVAGIVTLGAQMSSIICRSSFAVMMSTFPGGDMIHGFEPAHKTMEVRHQLRGKNIVDLMVTPCLIAGDLKGYTVLEKAEVMC
ncbi:PTB domain-containing engulfment adapter protein 1 [Microdochium nivale]|nr:PTB domain-containing engulfment adapter protein 1 [Microdochium nivale]